MVKHSYNYIIWWFTFPAPEQLVHRCVVGTCRGWSEAPDTEMGSMHKHTPLAEHRAQAKYPIQGIIYLNVNELFEFLKGKSQKVMKERNKT